MPGPRPVACRSAFRGRKSRPEARVAGLAESCFNTIAPRNDVAGFEGQGMTGWIAAACAGLAVLLGASAPASAAWQIEDFEVSTAAPHGAEAPAEGGHGNVAYVPPGYVDLLESYLGDVARYYDSLGFRQPALEPVVMRGDGRQAYRVYLYDYPDWLDRTGAYVGQEAFARLDDQQRSLLSSTAPSAYSVRCDGMDTAPHIRVDLSRAFQGGQLRARTMENLAHELFHAVQYGYALFTEDCSLGDWIVEGTAEAMGIDTAHILRGIQPSRQSPILRWGARKYHADLYVADDDPRRKADGYGTASFWRYVAEHMTARKADAWASVAPIEPDYRYLHTLFGASLPGAPGQAAELAWLDEGLRATTGLGLARLYPRFAATFSGYVPGRAAFARTEAVALRYWHRLIFRACPRLALSNGAPRGKVMLGLRTVAARCFKLVVKPRGPVEVSVHTTGGDLHLLRSLALGVSGGTQVARAAIAAHPERAGEYIANWRLRLAGDTLHYIIVANVAPEPAATVVQHPQLQFSISTWHATLAAPNGSPDVVVEPVPATVVAPKPAFVGVAAAPAAGSQAPVAYTGHRAEILRRDAEPPCQETGCGPVTAISLHPAAGTTQEALLIVIPRIEYGFAGTVDNARIGGSTAEDPLSGQVTVEEYTPFMLRGSFSAEGRIVGTFAVAAPWRGDRRAAALPSEIVLDDVRQDLVERFPALTGEPLEERAVEEIARRQAAIDARP